MEFLHWLDSQSGQRLFGYSIILIVLLASLSEIVKDLIKMYNNNKKS